MRAASLKPLARLMGRELLMTFFLLIGVSVVVFVILYLAPGDPFSVLLEGEMPTEAAREGIRQAMGVPTTWYSQYFAWLGKMLVGDFGTSIRTGMPVLPELLRVGWNTLVLTGGAMLVTLLVAVPVALYSAVRGVTLISWPLTILAYVISALPLFWLGYLVLYVAMRHFGIFPFAFASLGSEPKLIYFLLPILVLGLGSGAISEVVRHLREESSRVLDEEYVRTARAKGASVWRHAFKEGFLLPVTAIMATKVPFLIGGAIIVEQVFNWPGMGRMAWQAAQDRDYPVIMAIAIAAALLVRIGTLVQRVVYVTVNPRASQE
ncbi:MAG: hypothetical protein A2091_01220 [Desulfuromonadales bacterium GWD2_61_12]|nr:MAG: hypothetical protein A2005_07110 [Desulfuromonadales bacterium GWC2_61_20]OGR34568.1 MAG: hypothetical protein A2091_01220 [Desulfuromonadales bacterium GWD2_61_12]